MDGGRNWYAIHVKSRHEFVASEELCKKGVESFLPSVTRVRQWKDRKKLVRFALFPGYLFVHTDRQSEGPMSVLKTRGVVSFVCLEKGCPARVSTEEIDSLRALLESGADIDVHPRLRPGSKVNVIRGPLKDAKGVLASRDGRSQFVVNIDILGRSAAVEISADDIEAC